MSYWRTFLDALMGRQYCTAALREAYFRGWLNCAAWANRDDLMADTDSPAYAEERDEALGRIAKT